jgi:hypothetical protein
MFDNLVLYLPERYFKLFQLWLKAAVQLQVFDPVLLFEVDQFSLISGYVCF